MEGKDARRGPRSVSRGGLLSLCTPEGARVDCALHLDSLIKGLRVMGMNLDLGMYPCFPSVKWTKLFIV